MGDGHSGGPASRARFGSLLAAVGAVVAAVQGWRLWGSPEFLERAPTMPVCAFLVVVGVVTFIAERREARGQADARGAEDV